MSTCFNSSILDSIEILLSHYRYIAYIHDMQEIEYRRFIGGIREDIYPAFINNSTPLSDVYIKNIINDYLKIMRFTINKISNTVRKENRNGNKNIAKKLKLTLDILNLKYFNKTSIPQSAIIDSINISKKRFYTEQKKAIEIFAEYMLPIATKKGYETIISYNTIAMLSVLETLYKNASSKNKKCVKAYQYKNS